MCCPACEFEVRVVVVRVVARVVLRRVVVVRVVVRVVAESKKGWCGSSTIPLCFTSSASRCEAETTTGRPPPTPGGATAVTCSR